MIFCIVSLICFFIIFLVLKINERNFRALYNLIEYHTEHSWNNSLNHVIEFSSQVIPTIFIGGLDGSDIKIKNLIKSLGDHDNSFVGEILIDDMGSINSCLVDGKTTNPLIQLKFSQKHANLFFYDIWLKNTISYIAQRYSTQTINLVGYSLGGVIATRYVCNRSIRESHPRVRKLVTLGSPILGSYVAFFKLLYSGARDIIPHSTSIKNFKDYYVKNFDPDTEVLSYAGGLFDCAVTKYSAHGLGAVKSNKNFILNTTDKFTFHGKLTSNIGIQKDVSKFLFPAESAQEE